MTKLIKKQAQSFSDSGEPRFLLDAADGANDEINIQLRLKLNAVKS